MDELIKKVTGQETALERLLALLSKRLTVWMVAFFFLREVITSTTEPAVAAASLWVLAVVTVAYLAAETASQIARTTTAGKVKANGGGE